MLTKQWFYDNMPEKVETIEDYAKIEKFLLSWQEMSGGDQETYDFIVSLKKKELKELSVKVWNLANSFLNYCLKKYNMFHDFLQANQGKLSNETMHTLIKYGDTDIERSKAIAEALKGIATMLEI